MIEYSVLLCVVLCECECYMQGSPLAPSPLA